METMKNETGTVTETAGKEGSATMMAGIRNLVFDVGQVLMSYRWEDLLIDYGLSPEDAHRVGRGLLDNPYWGVMDYGTESQETIIAGMKKCYPEDADAVEYFMTHPELMHVGRPRVWARVHELKQKGYHMFILSNYSEVLYNAHTHDAPFHADMDGEVVSYKIHMCKPDIRIYRYLLDTYGLKAEESVFFDDRQANVNGAIAAGMKFELGTSEGQLLKLLEKY